MDPSNGSGILKPFMNMSDNNKSSSGGVGFVGLLTVAFIVLKLCGVIQWSWWWVLSPLWITGIVVGLILAALLVVVYLQYRKRAK